MMRPESSDQLSKKNKQIKKIPRKPYSLKTCSYDLNMRGVGMSVSGRSQECLVQSENNSSFNHTGACLLTCW